MSTSNSYDHREWLISDRSGGYAMGSACGIALRRYHGLLITPTRHPLGRMLCLHSMLTQLHIAADSYPLSSLYFPNNVTHPDGATRLEEFRWHPHPQFLYRIGVDLSVLVEYFLLPQERQTAMLVRYTLSKLQARATLELRPLIAVRDHHALHRENSHFNFNPSEVLSGISWRPYPERPSISIQSCGEYQHAPLWYYNVRYPIDEARGYPALEDLASPGEFKIKFTAKVTEVLLQAGDVQPQLYKTYSKALTKQIKQNSKLPIDEVHHASFFAKRGEGLTIIAGYPWFGDWGRDTFIAIRGLCLASNKFEEALKILLQWSHTLDQGMIPNRFPEGGVPEFNSVDASLWYVISAYELLIARKAKITKGERSALIDSVAKVINAYSHGTRFGIVSDSADGLLWCGQPNSQLTWMDAKFDGIAVTPRVGKPVEIQALWINSLFAASELGLISSKSFEIAKASFEERFWCDQHKYLADVIDCNQNVGHSDWSVRPNQIFAVGGLPLMLLSLEKARSVVDRVEHELVTPLGLRTLSPQDHAYCPRYEGTLAQRDAAYHQGTVWPWLMGAFVEAWLRVRSNTRAAKAEANLRFVAPLGRELESFGLGALAEIADGEAPHTARGAPFQAWSLAEYLRVKRLISL